MIPEKLFLKHYRLSLQIRTSAGTTSDRCFMPENWKNSETAQR